MTDKDVIIPYLERILDDQQLADEFAIQMAEEVNTNGN